MSDTQDRGAKNPGFAGYTGEFDLTEEFCAEYDSPAFDPSYDTPPLEHYEPLIRQLMVNPIRSIYIPDED